MYSRQRDFASALQFDQKALNIAEKLLEPDNPDLCMILNSLAETNCTLGNLAAAQALFERRLKIREKVLGPMNSYTALSRDRLAWLYESQGNYAAALPLAREALGTRPSSVR